MMRNDDPGSGHRPADDFTLAQRGPGAVPTPTPAPYGVTAPGDVQGEIEQTRAEMSSTLEAIQEKLNPTQLKDQAKDVVQDAAEQAKQLVQDAAKTAAEQAKEVVHEAVQDAAEQAKAVVHAATQDAKDAVHDATVGRAEEAVSEATERVRGMGSIMLDTIKQNPVPAALAGIGLGWLFLKRSDGNSTGTPRSASTSTGARRLTSTNTGTPARRGQEQQWSGSYPRNDSSNYGTSQSGDGMVEQAKDRLSGAVDQVQDKASRVSDQVQDKAGRVTDQVQDAASHVADTVQNRTERVSNQFQRMQEESPLALGALALAAGVTAGLLLPTTEHEDELVGQARDRVMHKARETVKEVQPKVEGIVEEVTSAARSQGQ